MKPKEMKVEIEGYSKKGWGVGRAFQDGECKGPCEIPFTSPGDLIKALLFKRKQKVFLGSLVETMKSSPSRVTPKCQHANRCGGCFWQHVLYEDQLKEKQNKIEELFSDFLKEDKNKLQEIIRAEPLWHYRNKMEFSFSEDSKGSRYLGLIEANSQGKVINLDECHLAPLWMIRILKAIKAFWENEKDLRAYNPRKNTGILRTLTLREGFFTQEKMIMLTISGSHHERFSQGIIDEFKKVMLMCFSHDETISIFLQVIQARERMPTQAYEMHLHGKDHITETLAIEYKQERRSFTFKISPSSFFQPNSRQAERLYSKALEMVTLKKGMTVLDLYCGTATLGIIFSSLAEKVIGIEINPYAVFDAEVNIKRNGVHNIEIYKGDVKIVLEELKVSKKLSSIDLVIVDPPRAGLDAKALMHLMRLSPYEILYISCNPSTQKENIKELLTQGYQLKTMQPVDMFPHTPHIENIALLQKKNGS